MGGLLLLAFAFLAVGQAGVNRGGAQTAADAAALAAAQETRDQITGDWVDNVLDPTKWQDILDGLGQPSACWRAGQLASANDATLDGCTPGLMRYSVAVRTNKSVGDSVVPGTESYRSTADAEAVIEPRCTFTLPTTPPTTPPATPSDGDEDPGDGGTTPPVQLPELRCDGGTDWILDPLDLTGLPKPQDLFDVHLVG